MIVMLKYMNRKAKLFVYRSLYYLIPKIMESGYVTHQTHFSKLNHLFVPFLTLQTLNHREERLFQILTGNPGR